MEIFRKLSVFCSCFLFAVCSLLMGLFYSGKIINTEALSYTDSSSCVKVNEIWDGNGFSANNVNSLLRYISGNGNASIKSMSTIDSMASNKTNASQIRAKTYGKSSSQDVVVKFGNLEWQVVYLSKDNNGNSILTLWLANSTQSAFSGRSTAEGSYFGFYNSGFYSSWSANWYKNDLTAKYPANMYGASYIRAVTLNNGGQYSTSITSAVSASQNSNSAFAKFTMPSVSGSFTKYIVKPIDVRWQEYGQNRKTIFGSQYSAPNENWSPNIPNNGSYMGESYTFGSSSGNYTNYANNALNQTWARDYIWLPSLSEVGYSNSYIGMWKLSENQLKNYDGQMSNTSISGNVGTVSGTLSTYSWLRSGDASSYNYQSDAIQPMGSGMVNGSVYVLNAVRPAFHLNLSEIAKSIPDEYTFVTNYNGGIYSGATSSSYSGVKAGGSFTFNVPTKTGYDLIGWKCSYNNKIYNTSPTGTLTLNPVENYGTNGATVTFTAQWAAKSYTVAAIANGGTITSTRNWTGVGLAAMRNYSYGSAYGELPDVKREGCTLKGWFDAATGGNQISTTVSNGSSSSTKVLISAENHMIYAQWDDKSYTITFNANEGAGTMSEQSVRHGMNVYLNPNKFTRSGYVFAGWSTTADGEVEYTDLHYTAFYVDLTLYAIWEYSFTSDVEAPVLNNGKYEISSPSHLGWMAKQCETQSLSGDFIQTASIDLFGMSWTPIGNEKYPFKGNYDGQGYSISSLYITGTNAYQGLFGYTNGSKLSNIRIVSGKIVGGNNVGSIVGDANATILTNCVNHIDVEGSYAVGGLVGYSGTITTNLCYNYGNVTGKSSVGGIVGRCTGDYFASNILVKSSISGDYEVGGLIGSCMAKVHLNNYYFNGTLKSVMTTFGVVAGYLYYGSSNPDFENCYIRMTLFGNVNALGYGSIGVGKLKNSVFEIGRNKFCYGDDFSNWIITKDGLTLPKELAWIGGVGDQLSLEKLQELGYWKVS